MFKFLYLSLFFLTFTACSTAPKTTSEIKAPFYAVEKNGERVAYLLGTIHYGVNFSSLSEKIKTVARSSDVLVLETNLLMAQPLILKSFPMGAKDSLKKQLSEKEWNTLFETVKNVLGPNAEIADRMHPFMAQMTYILAFLPQTQEPIDLMLQSLAINNGQRVEYLESPEHQIEVLLKTQKLDQLKETLNTSTKELNAGIKQLLKSYSERDIQTLTKIMHEQLKKEDQKIILTDRNNTWSKTLVEKILPETGIKFIAVGAGHLGGETGLVKQFQNSGYKITTVEQ